MHRLDADAENAWRYCFEELSQITHFRCALLVQLIEMPEAIQMPIRFTWSEQQFSTPLIDELHQAIWLKWLHCRQCQVLTSARLPYLEFQQALHWQVRNLVLIPLHSLSGKALGGLLLLHDEALLNQEEFLRFAEPLIRYVALLLEYSSFKYKQALPLNTLRSELNALHTNNLFTQKNLTILNRLHNALEQLSALSLQSFQPSPILPCAQNHPFSLRQLLEQFIAEQKNIDKRSLRLHLNADIPLSLEGDERIVRQLFWNLYQQVIDMYPNVQAFNAYVWVLGKSYPQIQLKLSICPDSYPQVSSMLAWLELPKPQQRQLVQRAEVVALLCQIVQGDSHLLPQQAEDSLWISFHLKRSAAVNHALQQETAALLEDNPSHTAQPLKNFHILVAEDSPINQTVINKMLNRLGYPCTLVDNGLKLLEAWEKGDYDLILMDCEMPELDGYDAAAAIRQREQSQGGHIPIIALTAHALAEHRERSRAVGMDEHLSKPISLPVLKDTLDYWEQQCAKMPASTPQATETQRTPAAAEVLANLEEDIIDRKTFNDLQQVLGDKFTGILQQFLSYAPQQLKLLQAAKTQLDCESLRSKAHQFKGEAAQIGAVKLSRLCKELEMLMRSGNINTANDLLERIALEVQKVIKSLEKELNA